MTVQTRILIYSILFSVYLFSTEFLLSLGEKFEGHSFIVLGCGFAVINLVYSFLVLKWTPLLNIACSILIASIALFLAMKFGDLHLFSKYDPYAIKTCIIANAVFSILFWEIVYQVKIKKSI